MMLVGSAITTFCLADTYDGSILYQWSACVTQEPRTPAICLFANALPHALEAVTNGVRVRVSSTFVPEMSRELPPRFFFAYRCLCWSPSEPCACKHTGVCHGSRRCGNAQDEAASQRIPSAHVPALPAALRSATARLLPQP